MTPIRRAAAMVTTEGGAATATVVTAAPAPRGVVAASPGPATGVARPTASAWTPVPAARPARRGQLASVRLLTVPLRRQSRRFETGLVGVTVVRIPGFDGAPRCQDSHHRRSSHDPLAHRLLLCCPGVVLVPSAIQPCIESEACAVGSCAWVAAKGPHRETKTVWIRRYAARQMTLSRQNHRVAADPPRCQPPRCGPEQDAPSTRAAATPPALRTPRWRARRQARTGRRARRPADRARASLPFATPASGARWLRARRPRASARNRRGAPS